MPCTQNGAVQRSIVRNQAWVSSVSSNFSIWLLDFASWPERKLSQIFSLACPNIFFLGSRKSIVVADRSSPHVIVQLRPTI